MSCLWSVDWPGLLERFEPARDVMEWGAVATTAFGLIALAEIGDKSQLVCMTLAARYHHRALPIVLGATTAFALLNLAAVLFGAAVAHWLPERVVVVAVAILFAVFGLRALMTQEHYPENGHISRRSGHGVFLTTFLLIFVAEFGDKTQLAIAGMSVAVPPAPVWLGGTLALVCTSAMGVWAGRALLKRMPLHWLHRLSGWLFLGFAVFTVWRLLPEPFLAWLDAVFLAIVHWSHPQY